jgi:hypothetical protein
MLNKVIFSVALTIFSSYAFPQLAINQYTGKPYIQTTNNDASGSPFLFEDWTPGKVFLFNGNQFDNVMLKFDALRNKFFFNRNDSTFELEDDVTEVRLQNANDASAEMDFKKIVTTDNRLPMAGFVQVLASGKVPLYKLYAKRIEGENTTNGIFSSEKKIVTHNSLWTIINNESIPVKLNSRSLEELTSDKKDQVQDYVKSKKLNVKNEKDFAAAVAYYNSLAGTK